MQIAEKLRSATSKASSESATGSRLPALPRKGLLARLVREPLIPFLLVGGAIFGAYYYAEAQRGDPIRYTPDVAKQIVGQFEELSGRKATDADKKRLRDDYINEEILFREALARNMHLADGEVRERLIDQLRYLIAGAPLEPSEDEVIDYYASHPDLYRTEPGITFSQIFFAQEPKDAAGILARLERGETVSGDDFWLGRAFPNYGNSMIRGMFGQPFLQQLQAKPVNQWYGPVRSGRGWHFVRKTGTLAPAMIPYADARAQVRQDFMLANTQQTLDKAIETLKEKYDVEITD